MACRYTVRFLALGADPAQLYGRQTSVHLPCGSCARWARADVGLGSGGTAEAATLIRIVSFFRVLFKPCLAQNDALPLKAVLH